MSQATELRALLSKLSQHIGSAHDEHASLRLLMRAERWRETVVAAAKAGGGGSVLSPSDLETAGERLDRIAGRLTAACAALPSPAGFQRVRIWQMHLTAACILADGCANVLSPATVLTFGRCVTLVLGPGRLLFNHLATDSGVAATLACQAANYLSQLRLMTLLSIRVRRCDRKGRDEWTAQLAPPSAVVAWLEAATAALVLAHPDPSQTAKARADVTAQLASLIHILVTVEYCTPYAAAIAVSDSLPANLVTLLVPAIHQAAVVLQLPPERRSQWRWCTWDCAADMAAILSSNALAGALKEHVSPPAQDDDAGSCTGEISSNAQRLLATACQLMAHVPLDMADETPSLLGLQLRYFAALLSTLCLHAVVAVQAPTQQQLAGQWGTQHRRLLQHLVQVLPRLPATLQLLVQGGPLQHQTTCVADLSRAWALAANLLQALLASCRMTVSSWPELSAWCAACTALLKGHALTAELAGQYKSQPKEQDAISDLEAALGRSAFHLASGPATFAAGQCASGCDAPLPAATVSAAETALWDLHTAQCRSAHRQTADRIDDIWYCNLDSTNQTLLTAWRVHQCANQDVSQPFGRHGAAMAAAHCQMLQAVVCNAGHSEAVLQQRILFCMSLASAIAVCGAMCPAVLTLYPALVDLQHRALVADDGQASHKWVDMMLCMAQAAAASPHVTAHMLASGAMETMLQQLESSGALGAALLGAQDGSLAGLLAAAYQALACTADDVLSAASGGNTAVTAEELQDAQRSLKAVLDSLNADLGVSGGGQPSTAAAATAKVLREEAQPAAGQLAAALLMLWTQPDQRKEAALELAHASAARSCAYLSCSNVCGGDGPAAGQGVGSKRCSQCHTAYYCGPACAHADWRQGRHGRVCKALAGARQAAQQQPSPSSSLIRTATCAVQRTMSQATELRALLSKLSQHIGSSPSQIASLRLLMRAQLWWETVVAAAEAGGGSVLSPSDFEGAGQRLDRIAGRLTAAWEAVPSPADFQRFHVWQMHFTAACILAEGCANVIRATASGLTAATVLAFGRCVTLVLGPGRLLLSHLATDSGVTATLTHQAANYLSQLRLMTLLSTRVLRCDRNVRDEWTTHLAPPSAVVTWLEAAAAAVVLAPPDPSQTAEAKADVTAQLASVIKILVTIQYCTPYAAAIAVSDSLPANLMTLLVPAIHHAAVVLQLPPERQSQWRWCTWDCAADMAAILSSTALAGALKEHVSPPAQADDLRYFAALLSTLCSHAVATVQVPMQQQLAGQWGTQHRRLLQHLVQLLVQGGPLQHQTTCVADLSRAWALAANLLQALLASCRMTVSSWPELSAWCATCTALLKGHALTAELAGQYKSQPKEQDAISDLEAALGRSAFHLASGPATFAAGQCASGCDAPLPAATVSAAETALWDLHTAQCRSAHRQTADRIDDIWYCNLDSTNQTLLTAWRVHQCANQDVSQPFGRHGAAMAAAHCQMLQAVVCNAGHSEAVLQQRILFCMSLASAIAVCGAMCPAVLTLYPALVDLQHRALVADDGQASHKWVDMMLCMAQAAAASPHVTAHMLASGAMETMLQQLESSGALGAALLGAQDGSLAGLLADAYQALVCTADDVLSAASGGSSAVGTEELQAAQQTLKTVLDSLNADLAVSGGQASSSSAAAAAKMLREEAQPAAGRIAAALLMLWTQPDQRKEAALELAHASAARSCAYLSCSNVCGGDGPAAGQGVGSKRCSQCHTAYYCGPACAHADWRQGRHGRVCKALAGARQAAQQQ
ncbi:hypothetical protein ACK3TF_004068 [Chlorella vulgaris]